MTDMLYTLTETFLELLLLTLTSVNHNLLSKIDEDFNIISSLCLQYKGTVTLYILLLSLSLLILLLNRLL